MSFPAFLIAVLSLTKSAILSDDFADFVHQFRRFCQVADGFSSVGWCFLLCPDILFVHKKAVSG
ncbi:hypothetical protein C7120_02040 [Prevotella sp. oral taxon 376]|nr:hypothetical protein C7120_02040 [Prevotella sp. oral taxon 376]